MNKKDWKIGTTEKEIGRQREKDGVSIATLAGRIFCGILPATQRGGGGGVTKRRGEEE